MKAQTDDLSQASDLQNHENHFRRKKGRISYIDFKQEIS